MSMRPWMKFYPSDWLADMPLKSCSAAARGLWIDMIAIMHSVAPTGHLVLNDRPMPAGMLAVLTGVALDEVERLLAELESAGVFSRRDDGAIYSRRMIRDEEKALRAKETGSRGGSPALTGKRVKRVKGRVKGRVNPTLNGGVKAHWHLASGLSRKEASQSEEEVGAEPYDEEAPFGRDGLH